MAARWALIVVCACRIDFDPRADGALADAPGVPGMRVTTQGAARAPSLVWTGQAYGLAWEDTRSGAGEIYMQLLGPGGIAIGPEHQITHSASASVGPSLVVSAAGFGVAWQDDRSGTVAPFFVRLDPAGTELGMEVPLAVDPTASAYHVSAAWTGTEYVVAWPSFSNGGGNEIMYAHVASDGTASPPQTLTNPGVELECRTTWTGTDLVFAWTDAGIQLDRLSAPSAVAMTSGSSSARSPSMTSSGADIAIAWRDELDGNPELYLATFDGAGAQRGPAARLTTDPGASDSPSLIAADGGYAMAWVDDRDGDLEIYFDRYDAIGAPRGPDVRITNSPGMSSTPRVVWNGMRYAIAWVDQRDGVEAIYFAEF